MQLSDIENETQTERKRDQKEEIRKRKAVRKGKNIALDIIIKTLVVCAMIDIPIWAYFHFVQKTTVIEGLERILGKKETKKEIISKKANQQPLLGNEVTLKMLREDRKPERNQLDEITNKNLGYREKAEQELKRVRMSQQETGGEKRKLYSWIDEKGNKAFSNTGFPEDRKYTDGKIEWY